MAQADNKPTLDLMAAINLAQNDATSTQGYQYKNKQLGVQYSVPLYSGGGNSSAVRQATLVSESSKIETEALSFKLQMEFDNNWSQLVGAVYRQTATLQSLQSAEEQLKATKRHVELGVKTIGDQAVIESIYSRRLSDLVIITQDYLKLKFKLKYKI
jgi:outer membrane protein TolC